MIHRPRALIVVLLLNTAATQARAAASARASESQDPQGVVNINTASSDELQRLPRIGPELARRIIAYRERREFRRVGQLRRVRGIGRRTFARLRPYVTLHGPTTLKRKARAR